MGSVRGKRSHCQAVAEEVARHVRLRQGFRRCWSYGGRVDASLLREDATKARQRCCAQLDSNVPSTFKPRIRKAPEPTSESPPWKGGPSRVSPPARARPARRRNPARDTAANEWRSAPVLRRSSGSTSA